MSKAEKPHTSRSQIGSGLLSCPSRAHVWPVSGLEKKVGLVPNLPGLQNEGRNRQKKSARLFA